MKESEYLKLKKKIEDRARSELDALEQVWRIANNSKPPTEKGSVGPSGVGVNSKIGNEIKALIPNLKDEFTVRDIDALLQSQGKQEKKPTISQVLNRLAKEGDLIELIKTGSGRAPSVYKKINPA